MIFLRVWLICDTFILKIGQKIENSNWNWNKNVKNPLEHTMIKTKKKRKSNFPNHELWYLLKHRMDYVQFLSALLSYQQIHYQNNWTASKPLHNFNYIKSFLMWNCEEKLFFITTVFILSDQRSLWIVPVSILWGLRC